MSNIVNSSSDKSIYKYTTSGGLQRIKMGRLTSLLFLLKKLKSNISARCAGTLPEDITIGGMVQKDKPHSLPSHAQYLGGVGEGAWFYIDPISANRAIIHRFTQQGELEYSVLGETDQPIDFACPYQITYDSHLLFSHLQQNNQVIRVKHLHVLVAGETGVTTRDKYA